MSNHKQPSILGIISYKVFPAQMGGQNSISEFYAHLSEYAKVTLIVSKDNEINQPYQCKRLRLIYNHWWGILNLKFLFQISEIIKKQEADFIFIEHSYFGWLGYLLRKCTNKPLVLRSHNMESQRFRSMKKAWWRIYAGYEKLIHRQADFNLFVTEEDKVSAINQWNLKKARCHVATYGTSIRKPISFDEKRQYREKLRIQHNLPEETRLFLFNGTLDYIPNLDAIEIIVSQLIPALQLQNIDYRIFICGNKLPKEWQDILITKPTIIYLGYVESISPILYGTDCFINPVNLGGGIKTKLIDALSHNLTSISTYRGAQGIDSNMLKNKLILVDDLDWTAFAKAMSNHNIYEAINTPNEFYEYYNWNTIVKNALEYLKTNE